MKKELIPFLFFLLLASCSPAKQEKEKISISKVIEDTTNLTDSRINGDITKSVSKDLRPDANDVLQSTSSVSTLQKDTSQMNKVEKLKWLHDRTVELDGKERIVFENLFLGEFPNSFREYRQLYGYDMDTGAAPLYSNMNHVMLFASLKNVDKRTYYNKYLNISVDGVWEADNMQDFGVYRYMITDPETMLSVMGTRNDEQILSIMRFVFDGPHPDNYQEQIDTLISIIRPYNERVADLTIKSYQQLISEHDGHGH